MHNLSCVHLYSEELRTLREMDGYVVSDDFVEIFILAHTCIIFGIQATDNIPFTQ